MGLVYYRTKFGISAAMSPIVELLKKKLPLGSWGPKFNYFFSRPNMG